MTIVRLAHYTDPHLCPLTHKPSSRTDNFHEHVDAKWDAMCDLFNQYQIDHVLMSGDLCHLKTQSNYLPRDINRMSAKLEKIGRPLSIIPGNHDLPKSSIDNYEQTAFKAAIKGASNVKDVAMSADGQLSFSVHKVYKNGQPTNIDVTGLPYVTATKFPSMVETFNQFNVLNPESINITMLHVDALPRPDALPLPFETFIWKDLTAFFPNSDLLCLGHIHQSFPMEMHLTETGRKQIISKPWSFTRTVNDVYVRAEVLEQSHRPAFTYFEIDTETREIKAQYIPIPIVPFKDTFNPKTLSNEIKENEQVMSMVSNLKAMLLERSTAKEGMLLDPLTVMQDLARERQISEDIVHTTINYLHEAGVR